MLLLAELRAVVGEHPVVRRVKESEVFLRHAVESRLIFAAFQLQLPFAVEACQPGIRQSVDVVIDSGRAVIAVPVPVHGAAEQVVPVLVAVDRMLFRVYCFLKLIFPLVEPELGGKRLQLTAYSCVVLGEILVEIHQLAVGV